jgi:hypothetical protein
MKYRAKLVLDVSFGEFGEADIEIDVKFTRKRIPGVVTDLEGKSVDALIDVGSKVLHGRLTNIEYDIERELPSHLHRGDAPFWPPATFVGDPNRPKIRPEKTVMRPTARKRKQ